MKENKILINNVEVAGVSFEYAVGEVITMNSGQYPAKCVSKEVVDGVVHHHFIKGKFVPQFPE